MNKINFEISNCCDCPYHYKEQIYTTDPWEYVIGVYCSRMIDGVSVNKEHRLVCSDEILNVRKLAEIPDWCPMLNRNEI